MRQGDGSDLLGANDPRSASIGIIYVAPTDDRASVLEAILIQDELGRKQVAVVLPENNRAFQRPVDFDGLKNMRRGLKTEIIFVAPGVPGPAEFARQRRFTVYTSLDSYTTALRMEQPDNGNAKKGLLLFGRKPKPAADLAAPALAGQAGDTRTPQPVPIPIPLPVDASPAPTPASSSVDDNTTTWETSGAAPFAAFAGGSIVGVGLAAGDDLLSSSSSPQGNAGPTSNNNGTPVSESESAKQGGPQRTVEPIIFAPPSPQPRTTGKLPAAGTAGAGAAATAIPVRSGNTGKRAAVVAGAAAAGAGAALAASGRAPAVGGGQPPTRGNTGGSGSGGGGGGLPPRRTSRQLLAILLVILTLLLLAGIAFASPVGQNAFHALTSTTVTATVTITPDSKLVSDSFVITAVTGAPNPSARQVQARILSDTTPSSSASANATGSIPGARATGTLVFINIGNSGVTIQGGILTGGDGVQVSFGSFFVPIGSVNILGTAVNTGVGGNIRPLDINGTCCGSKNIIVKNPSAFSGGQNAVPNSVITQNDINNASDNLISSLKPSAQAALQKKVQSNEQVVNNTLNCTSNVTANHRPGDQAKSVTVTGTATCTEEVFDKTAALAIATDALKAEAAKNPGAGYALVGNVVTGVTQATVISSGHTVSLVVAAQGEWVFQFSPALQQQLKDSIATRSESDAQKYLQAVVGVSSVAISISSGNTMPAAANIALVIKAIPGVSGTSTPTPGSPTVGATPTGAPPVTPTTGLGGAQTTPTPVLGGS